MALFHQAKRSGKVLYGNVELRYVWIRKWNKRLNREKITPRSCNKKAYSLRIWTCRRLISSLLIQAWSSQA